MPELNVQILYMYVHFKLTASSDSDTRLHIHRNLAAAATGGGGVAVLFVDDALLHARLHSFATRGAAVAKRTKLAQHGVG